jgi:hypothetical protein
MNRRNVLGGVIGAFCGLLTWIPAFREKLGRSFGEVKKPVPLGSMVNVPTGHDLFYGTESLVTYESVQDQGVVLLQETLWGSVAVFAPPGITVDAVSSGMDGGMLAIRIKREGDYWPSVGPCREVSLKPGVRSRFYGWFGFKAKRSGK